MNNNSQIEQYCTVYIQRDENQIQSSQDLQKQLESTKIEDQIKALQTLIINIIHDPQYPRMIMNVINNMLPVQEEDHQIKQTLLFYWEIIEKIGPTGKLKDEMILVCNSIRNDLLHPNEYIRGRTLRLVSRVMYRGVLEPVSSAILQNLSHQHTYVRRNAVVALYQIFLNFGEELISDIDEHMIKLLSGESDLSTKRNAFLLLFHANQAKAMEFLQEQVTNDSAEDVGDILQLAVLELFRKTCQYDPSQKSRLMKAIFFFSQSKSSSVLFECANTLIQISNTPTTLKVATNIYVQLLLTITDNSVKMVILDKLAGIQAQNPSFLQEQLIDITQILSNQSIDIRKKALAIVKGLVSEKNITTVFPIISKEVKKVAHSTELEEQDYRRELLEIVYFFTLQFSEILEEVLALITEQLLTYQKIDEQTAGFVKQIVILIAKNYPTARDFLIEKLISSFKNISSIELCKGTLWIFGEFASQEQVEQIFAAIKVAIGSLPIEPEVKAKANETEEESKTDLQKQKPRVKTVILPDGTYGTEVIEESEYQTKKSKESNSVFREFLINNSTLSSMMARTLLKLIYIVRSNTVVFNRFASDSILIFCSLLRYYLTVMNKVDQDSVEKLNLGIQLLTNPNLFTKHRISWLEKGEIQPLKLKPQFNPGSEIQESKNNLKKNIQIVKQPDDLIIIRGLQPKLGTNDMDLSDDEVNDVPLKGVGDDKDFVTKLGRLVQLTGYSDPIYAEAFVNIHKYDISFEVFLINRTTKPLQNISVEFFTQSAEQRILQKANSVTLQPNQSANVKTTMKFSCSDVGLIFGAINYENTAGIQQANLVTKEISVDLMDFIFPAEIEINDYRLMWAKYEWENRINLNTNYDDLYSFVKHLESTFQMKLLNNEEEIQNTRYICANFYAQTKLDDDFLINLSAEIIDSQIYGYARIRSQMKGIVVNLGEQIKIYQNKVE